MSVLQNSLIFVGATAVSSGLFGLVAPEISLVYLRGSPNPAVLNTELSSTLFRNSYARENLMVITAGVICVKAGMDATPTQRRWLGMLGLVSGGALLVNELLNPVAEVNKLSIASIVAAMGATALGLFMYPDEESTKKP